MPKDTFTRLNKNKQIRIFEAALNEFSVNNFNESKLSNIIKEAMIPRGSFYQYFENKLDLYKYVFDKLGQIKLEYMKDLIHNPDEIPFLDLIRELYIIGLRYAVDNPKAVKMAMYLYSSKDLVYEEIMSNGLKQAHQFYNGYIESDKLLGRINKDIDTDVFSEMMMNLINNISFEEFRIGNENIDYKKMLEKFDKKIFILKKGILTGDKNV